MKLKTTIIPSYTIGEDALSQIGKIAGQFGERALIIGGKKGLQATEEGIKNSLKAHRILLVDRLWYGGECSKNNINLLIEQTEKLEEAEKLAIDVIIGVGGGKALDTAKVVANHLKLPIITVPTIAATCAATTPLSVVYKDTGEFEEIVFLTEPPAHVLISTDIISKAPTKYLWAGIGDTLAKYYEVEITSRGKKLSHGARMAKEISIMCVDGLVEYGKEALKDNREGTVSNSLEEVVLNIIITTGIVSMLIGEEHNGAVAHGLFYGLTLLEEIEKNHLHGEVVAYGVLVLLMLDGNEKELNKLYSFYQEVKLPTTLGELGVTNKREDLVVVLEMAVSSEDTAKMAFVVTNDLLWEAIQRLEDLYKTKTFIA